MAGSQLQKQVWNVSPAATAIGRQLASDQAANRLQPEDKAAHEWYRFVLSFPPHLVRQYLERFGSSKGDLVLDPFCGTGTTPVECQKRGVRALGLEANPMAFFAAQTKTDWTPEPSSLLRAAEKFAKAAARETTRSLKDAGVIADKANVNPSNTTLRRLPEHLNKLLLTDSICPLPLHRSLLLIDQIKVADPAVRNHLTLAMAKALVDSISNLHFGPEVGVRGAKGDVDVIGAWLHEVEVIARDLEGLRDQRPAQAKITFGDAREVSGLVKPNSVSAVITSPPYPNEKDYTRTTRLESVLLGFVTSKEQLQAMKKTLVRSNTRSVYVADNDDQWIADVAEVNRVANAIESRRIELGKTSGFEKQYHRVTRLYFGGMARHLAEMRKVLKPGAKLAYVVGDQASYLRVMIRTGQILAEIAERLGYEIEEIELFRTRYSTTTKENLREEVVVFTWPGKR